MLATRIIPAALLLALALPVAAHAQAIHGIGQAPDACGPGYFSRHPCGMTYGPNYWVYPPFPPWNGLLPCPGGGGPLPHPNVPFPTPPGVAGPNPGPAANPIMVFPTHPYARSPRDFFMLD